MQCGAKTRSGAPCKNAPVTGANRCRMHGGKTPRGVALPQTRHGRYSKDLPTRLLARYEEAVTDPELLNLSSEIALVDSMTRDVLESLEQVPASDKEQVHSHFYRLSNLTEQRRKLVETEQKRRVAMQNMMTSEQAGVMVATLLDSVKRHVSDKRALEAIAADVAQYFGRSDN